MATKDKDNNSEFPGYPHYPAKEDIMNSGENERIELDVENLSRSAYPDLTEIPAKPGKLPHNGTGQKCGFG